MAATLELEQGGEHQGGAFDISDILFAVFKHKGKIIIGTIIGIIAALYVRSTWPVVYQSEAKLLVRYVLDRSPVDPIDNSGGSASQNASTVTNGFGRTAGNVIGSEAEILRSWDLAVQTAEAIGPRRLLPELGDSATPTAAAGVISGGLEVTLRPASDIISVSYTNKEPQITMVVLDELVKRYFVKHLEVHRSAAAFDFVTQQSDQVRTRLAETEKRLKELKAQAGVTSMADSTGTLSADLLKIEDQYESSQTELAEQKARLKQIEQSAGVDSSEKPKPKNKPSPSASVAPKPISAEEVQQYQFLAARLADLRKARLDLLFKYTPGSEAVRLNQGEIENVDHQKRDMERKFPELIGQAPSAAGQPINLDVAGEKTRLAGLQARVDTLKARLDERVRQLSEVGSQIADLERKRELEETNYKYFQAAVEKARVDEALDPTKIPNISPVQRPSPPIPVVGKRDKIVMMLAGGGLAASIALVVLAELFLNRTVKTPRQIEKSLGLPLLLSIPYSRPMKRLQNGQKKRRAGTSELLVPHNGQNGGVASWEVDHFIRPYAEAIRDRLNLYFEINRMTHKPKLVGITSFREGAGSSTLASSLAASLSEMGDGKVLLVDVNVGGSGVHPFFEGKPAYPLNTALEPASTLNSASENLYLATVAPAGSSPVQVALKRFFDLMPNLKASDFDYIIFDMPPLNDTNPTLGMARFMDKVLLMVEAEETGRDAAKRGYAQLMAARANVSVILNKARSYVPKKLEGT